MPIHSEFACYSLGLRVSQATILLGSGVGLQVPLARRLVLRIRMAWEQVQRHVNVPKGFREEIDVLFTECRQVLLNSNLNMLARAKCERTCDELQSLDELFVNTLGSDFRADEVLHNWYSLGKLAPVGRGSQPRALFLKDFAPVMVRRVSQRRPHPKRFATAERPFDPRWKRAHKRRYEGLCNTLAVPQKYVFPWTFWEYGLINCGHEWFDIDAGLWGWDVIEFGLAIFRIDVDNPIQRPWSKEKEKEMNLIFTLYQDRKSNKEIRAALKAANYPADLSDQNILDHVKKYCIVCGFDRPPPRKQGRRKRISDE